MSLFSAGVRWYQQTAGAFALQPEFYPAARVGVSMGTGKVSKNNSLPITLDSRVDLVLTANDSDDGADRQFEVFRNTGSTGSLFGSVSFPVSPNPFDRPFPMHVIVFDMNSDGFPDVLTANRGLEGLDPVGSQFEGFSLQLNRQ